MQTILIVDDDAGVRRLLEAILQGEGYAVSTASSVAEAARESENRAFDLVLSELTLPDGDGLDVLRKWREHQPHAPSILITSYGTRGNAVEAMKMGASDYLSKPLSNAEELRFRVRRALESRRNERLCEVLQEHVCRQYPCHDLIGDDPRILQLKELAHKVAPTDATVLILGESGSGKEFLARSIHRNSLRAQEVFVPVNCAALSPGQIESEIFGQETGSLGPAAHCHCGRLEMAHGGTLFLDEVGILNSDLQTRLLRVLQERLFQRAGGTSLLPVDVRVIAATSLDLKQAVIEGTFREDLFYRLCAFPLEMPPLRERAGDVAPLARHFLSRVARRLGRAPLELTPEAEEVLAAYSWPGNVRELENLMERTAMLCEGAVRTEDLPVLTPRPTDRPLRIKDLERQAIETALLANHGNRTHTARQLGISVRTLQYRLRDYGLQARSEGRPGSVAKHPVAVRPSEA